MRFMRDTRHDRSSSGLTATCNTGCSEHLTVASNQNFYQAVDLFCKMLTKPKQGECT